MGLNTIKGTGNWGGAASDLNNNFASITAEVEKLKAANVKFKGYYTTELTLKAAHPSPTVGDNAWVGAEYPGTVYDVVNGQWHDTTVAPPVGTVNLSEYSKLSDVSQKLEEISLTISNEIINGDYSNGIANWSITGGTDGQTISSENGFLLIKLINEGSWVGALSGKYIEASAGDKFYLKTSVMSDVDITSTSNNIVGFYLPKTINYVYGALNANVRKNISCILNVDTDGTYNIRLRTSAVVGVISWGKTVLINLTKSFGAGKEPTVEYMDDLLNTHFNGWLNDKGYLTKIQISTLSELIQTKAEHGYGSESQKTLKQVDDEIVQLAGEMLPIKSTELTLIWNDGAYIHGVSGDLDTKRDTSYTDFTDISGALFIGYTAYIFWNMSLSFYDMNMVFISSFTIPSLGPSPLTVTKATIPVPIGAKFIRASTEKTKKTETSIRVLYQQYLTSAIEGNIEGNAQMQTAIHLLTKDVSDILIETDNLINLADPATFNYNQYLDTTGYKATAYNTRCVAPIEVSPGDVVCSQGLGYTDVQLGTTNIRIGGYLDASMNLLQILRMKTGSGADAVDTIYLNESVTGGAFIDTVPNIEGIKYFVLNFTSATNPTTNKIMVEKSNSLNSYRPYGSHYKNINPLLLKDYESTIKADLIDPTTQNILSDRIVDKDRISMYDRGSAPKQYVPKKVGIIVAGQSNTEGRVPSANFPVSYVDDLGVTTNYLDANNQIPLSKYCKRNISGTFGLYTKPSLWAYDAIVLSRLCHKLNDTVYMVNYSQGGTAISVNGANGGGFWTPRFEDIDAWNTSNSKNNSKMCELFEKSIRTAKSLDSNFEIKAFLWHQGEGDSAALAAPDYYKNFIEVISYVRGVVGNPTLPVIFGTIPHSSAQYNAIVEAAMIKIAADDPFIWMVDMSAGTLLDAYHFDAASSEYLGNEMYKIIRDEIL